MFDGTTADIMTLNLTSKYYSTSRDFAVVDTDALDVAADVKVFNADYKHDSVTPGAGTPRLVPPPPPRRIYGIINDAEYSLEFLRGNGRHHDRR